MIAGMSFGALSVNAKRALGIAATRCGISTCTGEGGMHPEEREHSSKLVMQYLPSRYGMNPYDLKKADMIEIGAGQGAKPGTGGVLLGLKMSEEVAKMRDLPVGIDQRSGCRHPDWMGADDLYMKLEQIREERFLEMERQNYRKMLERELREKEEKEAISKVAVLSLESSAWSSERP